MVFLGVPTLATPLSELAINLSSGVAQSSEQLPKLSEIDAFLAINRALMCLSRHATPLGDFSAQIGSELRNPLRYFLV